VQGLRARDRGVNRAGGAVDFDDEPAAELRLALCQ
jgi:hypothetical protein